MKTRVILMACLVMAFVSCSTEVTEETVKPSKLVFNVKVNRDTDTKAVKTAWSDGDVIYVFFNNVAISNPPKYATLTYDEGSGKWVGSLQGGLGIDELAATGETMSAVYFPLGTVTITAVQPKYESGYYEFVGTDNCPLYTYYEYATTDYTVQSTDGLATLTATLSMAIPNNYVQFFVDKEGEKYTTDGVCRLIAHQVRPAACKSYDPSGGFVEKDLDYGQPMWGYAYNDEGLLFSGQIDPSAWNEAADHRLVFFEQGEKAKTKVFTAALASHASVNLKNVGSWSDAVVSPTGVDLGICKNNDPNTGIKLLWANFNLGDSTPYAGTGQYNDKGFTLAWGEISPYSESDETWKLSDSWSRSSNYWCRSNDNPRSYYKYSNTGDILDSQDDAATAYLGSNWRMPTYEEMIGLLALEPQCYLNFYEFSGGKLIIPFGYYHSSTAFIIEENNEFFSWGLYLSSTSCKLNYYVGRINYLSVRPVQEYTE